MERNSRKRQRILECLKMTNEHPDAERIYSEIKAEYPRMSLATVYRNLNQLEKAGVIRCVGEVDGRKRFDAAVLPHSHAICSICGKVADIDGLEIPESVRLAAEKITGFSVTGTEIGISGICPECAEKIKMKNTGK